MLVVVRQLKNGVMDVGIATVVMLIVKLFGRARIEY